MLMIPFVVLHAAVDCGREERYLEMNEDMVLQCL